MSCMPTYVLGLIVVCGAGGCSQALPGPGGTQEVSRLRERALEALRRGVAYDALPSVRAQAIESFQEVAPQEGLVWIRNGLVDEHPAVRFAACMALGSLRDNGSRSSIESLLQDPDDSVRAAAVYALHRMGGTRHSGYLAHCLRDHQDIVVRRNAALIFGRLGEETAVRLLAGVMGDPDPALHAQALEAMALLGSEPAVQQLRFVANSGTGPEEVFALNALAQLRDPTLKDMFEYKLQEGQYLETRLAAAKALAELGSDEGMSVAMEGIRFNDPDPNLENDPPANQLMRVRQMSAAALGAIGDPAGLEPLAERLEDNSDPRVQVAAARAILRITNDMKRGSLPFGRTRTASRTGR